MPVNDSGSTELSQSVSHTLHLARTTGSEWPATSQDFERVGAMVNAMEEFLCGLGAPAI